MMLKLCDVTKPEIYILKKGQKNNFKILRPIA